MPFLSQTLPGDTRFQSVQGTAFSGQAPHHADYIGQRTQFSSPTYLGSALALSAALLRGAAGAGRGSGHGADHAPIRSGGPARLWVGQVLEEEALHGVGDGDQDELGEVPSARRCWSALTASCAAWRSASWSGWRGIVLQRRGPATREEPLAQGERGRGLAVPRLWSGCYRPLVHWREARRRACWRR